MRLEDIIDRADGIAFLATAGGKSNHELAELVVQLADLVKVVAETRQQNYRRFKPPTVAEVAEYCGENGVDIDAERFVNYYESQGWKKANGVPLKNWKAALTTWTRGTSDGATPI